jgi:hypothetical protein
VIVLEQVSHHPPALSTYAEGQGWTLYQEFTMTSKFRGQYLSITPLGKFSLSIKLLSFSLIISLKDTKIRGREDGVLVCSVLQ